MSVNDTTQNDSNLRLTTDSRDDRCRCSTSLHWTIYNEEETEREVIEEWRCRKCGFIIGQVRFEKLKGDNNA